jgi:pimeloyl-ACP methyl ester carboxylesterase
MEKHFARDLNAPLVRIEQGKHFTPEDHPETVANEIDRLLDEVRQAERAGGSAAQPEARR